MHAKVHNRNKHLPGNVLDHSITLGIYLTLMHVLLRKARRNRPHKNKANLICLGFVWTVSGDLRNDACKQNKVSAIASLMCKLYKLCHLPAFCVEPFNFKA